MQKQHSTHQESHTRDSVSETIRRGCAEGMEIATHRGTSDGKKGVHPRNNGRLAVFTEPVKAHFNTVVTTVAQMSESLLHLNLGKEKRAALTAKIKTEEQDIAVQEKNCAIKAQELKNNSPVSTLLKVCFVVAVLACISGSEIVYLSYSLQAIVSTLLVAIGMAVGISLALAAIAEYSPVFLNKIKSNLLRKLASWAIVLLGAGVYITLSFYRSAYIKTTTGQDVSPLPFILVTLALWLAIYLITQFSLYPALQELRQKMPLMRAYFANQKLQKTITKRKADLELLKESLSEFLASCLKVMSDHKADEAIINSNYYKAIACYKESVLHYHTSEIPDYFSDEPEPLQSFTDDLNI